VIAVVHVELPHATVPLSFNLFKPSTFYLILLLTDIEQAMRCATRPPYAEHAMLVMLFCVLTVKNSKVSAVFHSVHFYSVL